MTSSKNENNESTDLVSAFVGNVNNRINELLEETLPLHRYDEKKCSGGHYAPYIRATYKPKSEFEYNQLKEDFMQIEADYFALLKEQEQELRPYKNFPTFIDSPVNSVSLKSNTAYKSRRYKTDSDVDVDIMSIRYSETEEDLPSQSQAEQMAIEARDKLSEHIDNVRISDAGYNHIYLSVALSDLSLYATKQGFEHSSITLRFVTGVKYNARLLTENGEAFEQKYGFIIVHPKSSLNKNRFFKPAPRAKSHRSLERTSTRLNQIGEVKLEGDLEIWLNPILE